MSTLNVYKSISGIMVVLLLLCLLDMPYGFYMFVRFVAMFVFGGMAVFYLERENKLGYLFGVLALLFQPIFKFHIGREMWNIMDVACAVLLVGIILFDRPKKEHTETSNH